MTDEGYSHTVRSRRNSSEGDSDNDRPDTSRTTSSLVSASSVASFQSKGTNDRRRVSSFSFTTTTNEHGHDHRRQTRHSLSSIAEAFVNGGLKSLQ